MRWAVVFCVVMWIAAVAAAYHEYSRYSECRRVFSAWHCFMWR
jgi:DNA-binding transcriptional regulator of glucitol operon